MSEITSDSHFFPTIFKPPYLAYLKEDGARIRSVCADERLRLTCCANFPHLPFGVDSDTRQFYHLIPPNSPIFQAASIIFGSIVEVIALHKMANFCRSKFTRTL